MGLGQPEALSWELHARLLSRGRNPDIWTSTTAGNWVGSGAVVMPHANTDFIAETSNILVSTDCFRDCFSFENTVKIS